MSDGSADDNDPRNPDTARPWAAADVRNLRSAIAMGTSVEEIANVLCRPRQEVEDKAREFGWIALLAKQ